MFKSNRNINKNIGENAVTQNVQGDGNIVTVNKSDKINSDNMIEISKGKTAFNFNSTTFNSCQIGNIKNVNNK